MLTSNFKIYSHLLALAVTVVALSGCASTPSRGIVAMRVSETEAHAAVGPQDVKPGDLIDLYASRCGRHGCKRIEKGRGKVKERINSDYVVIEAPADAKIKEGDFFEKVK